MALAQKTRRPTSKQDRLETRIDPAVKRLIEQAASLRGTTLTDFVVASAQRAATETIKDFEMLSLRGQAREVFVQAIMHPPAPNRALLTAAQRYKERKGI